MIPAKIHFEKDDYEFMQSYKEATGISIQKFITAAVRELILKVQTEQAIKDSPFNAAISAKEVEKTLQKYGIKLKT